MKKPVRNIAADLRGQSAPGRTSETIVTESLRTGGPTMTVPGEGGVTLPPGSTTRGEQQQRSAALFGDAMAGFGGPRSDR